MFMISYTMSYNNIPGGSIQVRSGSGSAAALAFLTRFFLQYGQTARPVDIDLVLQIDCVD